MEDDGRLVRLFPIPFRLIDDDKQFKKWQWVSARIERARNDRRPESHRIFVDTIVCDGDPLPTSRGWQSRRDQLRKMPAFDDFAALDAARVTGGVTLGLLQPSRVLALEITPTDTADWTKQEKQKLIQHERQGGLFSGAEAKRIGTLRKLPFDFHYRYACTAGDGTREYRHKIVDWEAGALYWTCCARYGDGWEPPFRTKLEQDLPAADLMFLMGTIHRFPDQWLIVSLIYPPKQPSEPSRQGSLFAP
jgi:hypothetical protein